MSDTLLRILEKMKDEFHQANELVDAFIVFLLRVNKLSQSELKLRVVAHLSE